MTHRDVTQRLSECNSIAKENETIYRDAARAFGLSECAFWVLYALRSDEAPAMQSDICNALYEPKQTVHSALKKLAQEGYITLTPGRDRRSKKVALTDAGLALCARTVDRVIALEAAAFGGLTGEEQETFLRLFHKYTDLLRGQVAGGGLEK